MALTERSFDFTNRDFDSWRLELINRARTVFPTWTDFNTANFGNLLLELFAHTLDVLSFTQDQQFRETRITQAVLRKSMIEIGKQFGFKLPSPSAATVDLEITIASGIPNANDIDIPAGTIVQTQDPNDRVKFQILNDETIPAGQVQITGISAENSTTAIKTFVGDGTANQEFVLPQTPYIDSSAEVDVVGDTYEEVDSFFNSGPTDKHFIVETDQNDKAKLIFGNGTQGVAPSGTITITYKFGGGARGNIDANKVEFEDSTFLDTASNSIQLTVRNPSGSSGGLDRMTVEEARIAIPNSINTVGQRSVTRQDFENNALSVRGVARAMFLTSNEDPGIPENEGRMFIMPIGGGLPSTSLKSEVEDFINNERPPCITFTFEMEDPSLRIISISAEVFLNFNISETQARTAIENSLEAFFRLTEPDGTPNEKIDFGARLKDRSPVSIPFGEIPFSDLFNAVRDAADENGNLVLRKVEEDTFTPADDLDLLDKEFPVLGSVTLTNGDTGSTF